MVYVIKIGGTAGVPMPTVIDDIRALWASGRPMIVVHGGSAEADKLSAELGMPRRVLKSPDGIESRYTDPQTLKIITMAFAGLVNPALVSELALHKIPAVGLSGIDGATVEAELKPAVKHVEAGRTTIVRDNRTGRIVSINDTLLRCLLEMRMLPVISPPAFDLKHGPVNVDADRMAASIAVAIGAERLVFVSNTNGVLKDINDPESTISRVRFEDLDRLLKSVSGRMKAKIAAVQSALEGGVRSVHIARASSSSPIIEALSGSGTSFEPPLEMGRRWAHAG